MEPRSALRANRQTATGTASIPPMEARILGAVRVSLSEMPSTAAQVNKHDSHPLREQGCQEMI